MHTYPASHQELHTENNIYINNVSSTKIFYTLITLIGTLININSSLFAMLISKTVANSELSGRQNYE